MLQQIDEILSSTSVHHSIELVLQQFEDAISEKSTLPPQRSCDHEIPLKEGSKPSNVIPYKVPHNQKDEVQKLIQAMLQDATIRPSNSPYSSPAILARKKMAHEGCA
jgi:hypothetical protein